MTDGGRRPGAALASAGIGAAGTALACLLVAFWTWVPSRATVTVVTIVVHAVAGSVVIVDTLDLLLRLYFRRVNGGQGATSVPLDVGRFTPYQMRLQLRPFAIVASVHNLAPRAAAFVEGLGPFRERLFVIDDASTDDTADRLEALGVHVLRSATNRKKPASLRALLRTLPGDVATVVVLDPDVSLDLSERGGLTVVERVLFDFQRSGMAAACPRFTVNPDGLWSDFQALEYTLALEIGRRGLGDHSLTSGVSIYRRDALERTLSLHSLSVYAEDLSNALILLSADEKIYYDSRLVIATDGQLSLRRLFSQRVGWAFGLAQVFARDFDRVLRASAGRPLLFYQFVVYTSLIGLALHPIRVAGLLLLFVSFLNGADNLLHLGWIPDSRWTPAWCLPITYVHYTALVAVQILIAVPPAERARVWRILPLYFVYALFQTIPNTVGYLNWISLRLIGRRVYRDHYEADDVLIRRQMAPA